MKARGLDFSGITTVLQRIKRGEIFAGNEKWFAEYGFDPIWTLCSRSGYIVYDIAHCYNDNTIIIANVESKDAERVMDEIIKVFGDVFTFQIV